MLRHSDQPAFCIKKKNKKTRWKHESYRNLCLTLRLNVISFMKHICTQPSAPAGSRKNCTTLSWPRRSLSWLPVAAWDSTWCAAVFRRALATRGSSKPVQIWASRRICKNSDLKSQQSGCPPRFKTAASDDKSAHFTAKCHALTQHHECVSCSDRSLTFDSMWNFTTDFIRP